MSVQLHPDIETLDKESLCYSIYAQLYHNFFNAQQKKDDEHPYGIEEGDETSLRLKNTAYGFASAIAGAVTGEGGSGSGGLLLDYLKKSGGDMTGKLSANYGFEAGIGNTRILETYSQDITDPEGVVTAIEYGIRITGNLKVGGRQPAYRRQAVAPLRRGQGHRYNQRFPYRLSGCDGTFQRGMDYRGRGYRNIHLPDTAGRGRAGCLSSWQRQYGHGGLDDAGRHGETESDGAREYGHGWRTESLQGVELGDKGKCLLSFSEEDVALGGFLSFLDGFGIRIGDVPVLLCTDKDKIQFGSIGGDLLLGGDHTPKIRLFSGISDVDGECLMLSPYGKACFPGSLTVRHNYGADLLSSYRVDTSDEGIVIHKRLRMGTAEGFMFTGDRERVSLSSEVIYEEEDVRTAIPHSTDFSHRPSVSCYAPQNRHSESFHIRTDADFVTVAVPLEAAGHIGIHASPTRITDRILYLTEALRLQAVEDGIRHYGNSVFTGSLSSEFFSPGLSGSGWAVRRNRTTGGVSATFDEVVARRKFRAYEFEVEKTSVTNGSFWISDSCSGDTVEKLS